MPLKFIRSIEIDDIVCFDGEYTFICRKGFLEKYWKESITPEISYELDADMYTIFDDKLIEINLNKVSIVDIKNFEYVNSAEFEDDPNELEANYGFFQIHFDTYIMFLDYNLNILGKSKYPSPSMKIVWNGRLFIHKVNLAVDKCQNFHFVAQNDQIIRYTETESKILEINLTGMTYLGFIKNVVVFFSREKIVWINLENSKVENCFTIFEAIQIMGDKILSTFGNNCSIYEII